MEIICYDEGNYARDYKFTIVGIFATKDEADACKKESDTIFRETIIKKVEEEQKTNKDFFINYHDYQYSMSSPIKPVKGEILYLVIRFQAKTGIFEHVEGVFKSEQEATLFLEKQEKKDSITLSIVSFTPS